MGSYEDSVPYRLLTTHMWTVRLKQNESDWEGEIN